MFLSELKKSIKSLNCEDDVTNLPVTTQWNEPELEDLLCSRTFKIFYHLFLKIISLDRYFFLNNMQGHMAQKSKSHPFSTVIVNLGIWPRNV